MKYRELGSSGIMVSEIGLGCEGFSDKSAEQTKTFIDVMEQCGMNCLDLYTPNPMVRSNIGAALRGRREKFVLQGHLCTVWEKGQYLRTRDLEKTRASFEDQLERLGTDHLEIGMIHYSDSMKDWEEICSGGILDYARELKKAGTIRCIGLSSHNPHVALAAVNAEAIDVLMFSVNPCYDLLPGSEDCNELWNEQNYNCGRLNMDPDRQALYEACQKNGVGITVMKAFGGGDLLNSMLSPAKLALTPAQCIHYALTRPGAASVMCGCRSVEEILDAASYEDRPEEEKDYATTLASMPKIRWEGHCMYCGHCAPCPAGINVADVTKYLNLARAQGEVPETVREHYKVLEHHAKDCIVCGTCEGRCPFGVPVRENMKEAKKIFGY